MSNYATLKSAIQQVIKTNGNNEITGALLQQSLLSMINSLGAGYQFAGIATPDTNPGTPDQNVFYLAAKPGVYSNFNSYTIINEIVIFKYNGTWSIEKLNLPILLANIVANVFADDVNFGGSYGPNFNPNGIIDFGKIKDIDETKEYYIKYFIKTNPNISNYPYIRVVDGNGTTVAEWIGSAVATGTQRINIGGLFGCIVNWDIVTNTTADFNMHLNKFHVCVDYIPTSLPVSRQQMLLDETLESVIDEIPTKNSKHIARSGGIYNTVNINPVNGIILPSSPTTPDLTASAAIKKMYIKITDQNLLPQKLYLFGIRNISGSIGVLFRLADSSLNNIWQTYRNDGPISSTIEYAAAIPGAILYITIDWGVVLNKNEINISASGYIDTSLVNTLGVDSEMSVAYFVQRVLYPDIIGRFAQTIQTDINQKKILCLGDSITQFAYYGKRYSDILADISGATVYNAGFGGTYIADVSMTANPTTVGEARATFAIPNIARAFATGDWSTQLTCAQWLRTNYGPNDPYLAIVNSVKDLDISTIDIITVLGGTNDIGTTFISGTTHTIINGISSIVEALLTANPAIKLIFFTPIVRYFGDVSQTWDESLWCQNYINGANLSFNQLINEVVTGAQLNNVRYCNLYYELGITKQWVKANAVNGDGTHLYKAWENIAEKIYKEIVFD